MSEAVRETLCSSCVHCPVCIHKDAYLSMVKALEEAFHQFPEDTIAHMTFVDPICKFVNKKELDVINIKKENDPDFEFIDNLVCFLFK